MAVSDRERYNTTDPANDMPGLGKNPNLRPLDRVTVRKQFTFMDANSISDRERAIRFLLNRISDYYQVIGYVGPYMSNAGKSEIGCVLGGWIVERGYEPWREKLLTANRYHWDDPLKVFNKARYACFESALLLAAWEVSLEVPESAEALKRAAWAARYSIQRQCGEYWPAIRNRKGSKGMAKVLANTISRLEGMSFVAGGNWLGYFEQKTRSAA